MASTTPVFVLQTRWLGGDEWTNAVYAAATEEEAYAQALAAENQAGREDAEAEGEEWADYESLAEIAKSGEFFFAGWFVTEGGEA